MLSGTYGWLSAYCSMFEIQPVQLALVAAEHEKMQHWIWSFIQASHCNQITNNKRPEAPALHTIYWERHRANTSQDLAFPIWKNGLVVWVRAGDLGELGSILCSITGFLGQVTWSFYASVYKWR